MAGPRAILHTGDAIWAQGNPAQHFLSFVSTKAILQRFVVVKKLYLQSRTFYFFTKAIFWSEQQESGCFNRMFGLHFFPSFFRKKRCEINVYVKRNDCIMDQRVKNFIDKKR
jgi:hypothetical protein